jgi:hypothetical protein
MSVASLLLATGCGRDEIKVYTVPKEAAPPAAMADSAAPASPLKWSTPAGWTELPAGEFRVASFKITGPDGKQADVSVIPLPGSAGGDFSNVNRWRDQVGLPAVAEDELKKLAEPVEVAGQPAALYDQAGATVHILAVVQHRQGTAWFFKMTGDSQLVAQQKPAFVAFLKSFQFAAGTAAPETPAAAGTPQWTPPSDWKEAPGGQFLVAKFTVAGGQAAVNISSSPGNGGGVAANVNRWRKQLGLSELSSDELTKSVKSIGTATFFEMNGTDAKTGHPASLVGAIVLQPGQAWFYKLMGDATVVTAQQAAFTKFVQEVKY